MQIVHDYEEEPEASRLQGEARQYETPSKKINIIRQEGQPLYMNTREKQNSVRKNMDSDYDIPDGIQGKTLDSNNDQIQIFTSHQLKFPADYDEVMVSPSDSEKGYRLIAGDNLSPRHSGGYESLPDDYVPILLVASEKSVKANAPDYEIPVDADLKSSISAPNDFESSISPPTAAYDDYEIPHDAAII